MSGSAPAASNSFNVPQLLPPAAPMRAVLPLVSAVHQPAQSLDLMLGAVMTHGGM
jgi:hypothetical protein